MKYNVKNRDIWHALNTSGRNQYVLDKLVMNTCHSVNICRHKMFFKKFTFIQLNSPNIDDLKACLDTKYHLTILWKWNYLALKKYPVKINVCIRKLMSSWQVSLIVSIPEWLGHQSFILSRLTCVCRKRRRKDKIKWPAVSRQKYAQLMSPKTLEQ